MELRGRRIVEGAGVLWHSVAGRFYMSIPYQLHLASEPGVVESMLRKIGGLGARFPSLSRPGLASGLYICRDKGYDFPSLQPRQRTKVRRGLERCEIRRVEESELLTQGLQLNLDTMKRQGRYDSEFGAPDEWKRLVAAIGRSPTVVPMGAFVGSRLAAYAVTYREDGWLNILHQMSRLEDLEHYPNHALTFQVTREMATDPDLEAVSYGLVSLVSTEGLHAYKLQFGFEVVPHNEVFQLHPAVSALLASSPAVRFMEILQRLRPRDQRLERISTVLRGARASRQAEPSIRRAEGFPDRTGRKQERTYQ
jgi:hypothetical protein